MELRIGFLVYVLLFITSSVSVFAQQDTFLAFDDEETGALYYHSQSISDIEFDGPYDYDQEHIEASGVYSTQSLSNHIQQNTLDYEQLDNTRNTAHNTYQAYEVYDRASQQQTSTRYASTGVQDDFVKSSRNKHYFGGNTTNQRTQGGFSAW